MSRFNDGCATGIDTCEYTRFGYLFTLWTYVLVATMGFPYREYLLLGGTEVFIIVKTGFIRVR